MLGRVIGTGGANLRELEEERDARVDVADDGTIRIFAASGEGFRAAHDRILELAGENIKVGVRATPCILSPC
jgi:polyribonucleotide nucleotidyltransferase